MKKRFVYDRTIRGVEHTSIIYVTIIPHKYEQGFGPIVVGTTYTKPAQRHDIMETIKMALVAWYDDMERHDVQTVKVYVTGRPGEWIGDGPIPPNRQA